MSRTPSSTSTAEPSHHRSVDKRLPSVNQPQWSRQMAPPEIVTRFLTTATAARTVSTSSGLELQ